MLLICNRKSFILIDLEDKNDFLKTASSSKSLSDVKWLLYKWFQHYPDAVYEGIVDTGLYIYELVVPYFDGTNANYTKDEDYYYDYICRTYDLFGYVQYPKTEVLKWD